MRVTVTDGKEPIEFANVSLYREGSFIKTLSTNEKGQVIFKPLNTGKYDVRINSIGREKFFKGVIVDADRPTSIEHDFEVLEVGGAVVTYVQPLIPDFEISCKMPNPNGSPARNDINRLANLSPGVFSLDGGGLIVGGQRGGSHRILWNGVWINGGSLSGFPAAATTDMSILLGGFSAEYGDLLSGAISINTPRPGLLTRRSVEAISSSLFDKYHNNYAEAFFYGAFDCRKQRSRQC
ncbi:carboxypeptidase-like regulatory domain-containing protein [Oscillatoria amoena NRMC-F 0135]|nr:carboxypeptidase-like regulatory domain-containing protein [Oscillatoria amoena NRMC-F 0135]